MEALKAKFPKVEITIIKQDLSIHNSGQIIFDKLKNTQVDILINNAGFGDTGEFQTLKLEKQLNMIDLNVRVLTEFSHLFGSMMVKNGGGKIMNVASVVGFMPGPGMATYYASKAFVISLSQALSQEWGRYGVQVMALCPGVTKSGFQEASAQTDKEFVKQKGIPTSKEVAQYGYDKLMSGKTLVVHGLINKVYAFLPKVLPRKVYLILMERGLK
jgi:uncharacterized protein